MGGSGSGKTTLLNAVAHRLGGLPIEDGEVAYYASNGDAGAVKLVKAEVRRRIGFVRQQDFLVECLTGELPHIRWCLAWTYSSSIVVRETLTYVCLPFPNHRNK